MVPARDGDRPRPGGRRGETQAGAEESTGTPWVQVAGAAAATLCALSACAAVIVVVFGIAALLGHSLVAPIRWMACRPAGPGRWQMRPEPMPAWMPAWTIPQPADPVKWGPSREGPLVAVATAVVQMAITAWPAAGLRGAAV